MFVHGFHTKIPEAALIICLHIMLNAKHDKLTYIYE